MSKVDWSGFAYPKAQPKAAAAEYRKLKAWVLAIDGYRCVICRMHNPIEELQIHHRKTRGSGGPDDIDNCYAVCYRCHRWVEAHQEEVDWEGIDERRKLHKTEGRGGRKDPG